MSTKMSISKARTPSQRDEIRIKPPRERYDSQHPRLQEALERYWLKKESNDTFSIRQLATKHSIRLTTLNQLIKRRLREVPQQKPSHPLSLNRHDEVAMVIWILAQQALGFSVCVLMKSKIGLL